MTTSPLDVLRDATIIAGKDLRIEARSKVAINQVLPFVLAVVLLFGFALDAETALLRRVTSGLFWVTVLFATVIIVQRTFAIERNDGVLDALRLSGLHPSGIFLGKVISLVVQLIVIEVTLGIAVVVFYDVTLSGGALLLVTTASATVGIAAAGAVYGPLAAGARHRDTLLPLLLLPVLAPLLLASARAFEVALGRGVGGGWQWAAMLGIFALVYLTLGVAVWGPLLEDS